MAFQAKQRIISIHAHAVIYHFNKLGAAACNFYLHLSGTGIYGIFQKFLDH